MSAAATEIVAAARAALRSATDPSKAVAMEAYIKGKQSLYGVQATARKALQKSLFDAHAAALRQRPTWEAVIRELWRGELREERYVALDLLDHGRLKAWGLLDTAALPLLQELLAGCDHWDTLDALAPRGMAHVFLQLPREERRTRVRAMNACTDHMWTRRAAILVQLKYKRADADLELLSEVIQSRMHEEEFFIRKAIGWALREVSKWNPKWVREFVATHDKQLSGLSRREALKHL